MAVAVTITKLEYGARNLSYNLTGLGDGNGEATNITVVDVSQMSQRSRTCHIERISGSVEYGVVQLWWDASPPVKIVDLSGQINLDYNRVGGIPNPKPPGYTGNINLTTLGFELNSSFVLLLELVK